MRTPRVLIVEDSLEMADLLAICLQTDTIESDIAGDGRKALELAQSRAYDLVLLDLGLPDMDGVDVVRTVRRASGTPVLVLSARSDERQKIEALDAGADDYLTKPFGMGELLARVRVALRHGQPSNANSGTSYALDGLSIDLVRRRVQRDGVDIHLTPIEYKLLERLARSAGKVVTHRQLLTDAWGADFVEHTHYLRIYMGQLRSKIETEPADPRYLLTETGVGYRLADE